MTELKTSPVKTEAEIVAEITATMEGNIAALEAAFAARPTDYVYCWEKSGLAVRLIDGKPSVVGIDRATGFPLNDPHTFTNGANIPAVLTPRMQALETALANTKASWEHLKTELAKAKAKKSAQ